MRPSQPGSPRRSDGGEGEPSRGTSHRVALTLAIALTLLLVGGRFACSEWLRGEPRRAPTAVGEGDRAASGAPRGFAPSASAAESLLEGAAERVASGGAGAASLGRGSADAVLERAIDRWLVRCEVVDAAGPVADAEVLLALQIVDREVALATLRTAADGRAEFDATARLAPLAASIRPVTSLLATAIAPGHFTMRVIAACPSRPGITSVPIALPIGATARGRVVRPEGAPVAGAELVARAWPLDASAPFALAGGATRADGRFELAIDHAARAVVFAAAAGVGTARSEIIEFDPARDLELGDLVLRSRGAISGRTVDASGAPVADVRVEARRDGATSELSYGFDEEGAGLDGALTRSSADGRFEVAGLAPGSYRLATPEERSTQRAGNDAASAEGEAPLHPLGTRAALLIVERHRVTIVVQDEAGEPLPAASVLLHCGERVASGALDEAGRLVAHGRAGEQLVAHATAEGRVAAEGVVTFSEPADDLELVLTLLPEGGRVGAIALAVVDDEGRRIEPVAVTLRLPLGGLVEGWYQQPLVAPWRMERVPPGRYQLELFAGARIAGALVDSGSCFKTTLAVEVREGETTEVTARPRLGGRVRVTLRLPPDASRDSARVQLAEGVLARVTPDGLDRSLDFVYLVRAADSIEYGGLSFEPDLAYVAAPLLEPGVHSLRFSAPGFRPVEQSFTIRAGQISDLELHLEPN